MRARRREGGVGWVVGGASSREALTVEAEGRARAERTANIPFMSVTLDVSRLSGWLNARASCRVHRQGVDEGGHRRWGRFAGREIEGVRA